ncbi:MAG: FmdB family transcriptional regulator [Microthrixaceae bacterium]|nr:FmdB family transcriptional regulator [Microthrixaceae bacterium]
MPAYDYRCRDCGHEFETYQSFADDALTQCPECNGALRKVFGSVGISFKGSGFYKNDSRSGSSKGSAGSSSSTSSASSSSESSSSGSSSSESSSSSSEGAASSTSKPAKESSAAGSAA